MSQPFELTRAKRVGIYGGSFDPVHNAHIVVAKLAQVARHLDAVVFVPAARPPHKPGRVLASNADRAAMLALAIRGEPSWSVCEIEFERDGPSYTIDTLRELPPRLKLSRDVELYLILGADNLKGFERWRNVRELLQRVQPIVITRGKLDMPALEATGRALGPELYAKLRRGFVGPAEFPGSSSDVRARLARGAGISSLVPEAVAEYIRARGIYSAPPN